MNSNSKITLTLFSILSMMLLGILVFGGWIIRAKNQEAAELLTEADHVTEVGILAQFVKTINEEASQELEAFNNLVISSDKLVPLIESIEEVGNALDLEVKILSVDRIEDKKSATPPTFRIATETTGSWEGSFTYLNAIESLPARVMIERISLSKIEDGWQSRVVVSVHSFD